MPPTPKRETVIGLQPARMRGKMKLTMITRLVPVAMNALRPLRRATTTGTTRNSATSHSSAGRRTQSETTYCRWPAGAFEK